MPREVLAAIKKSSGRLMPTGSFRMIARIEHGSEYKHLQVRILLVGQGHVGRILHLLLVLLKHSLVDLDFWRGKCGSGDKFLYSGLAHTADKRVTSP